MTRSAIACVFALATLAPHGANALIHQSFDDSRDSRFVSDGTYPSWDATAPSNGTFAHSALDLSGVGWFIRGSEADRAKFAVTLVSPTYALTALHIGVSLTDTIRFRSLDGIVMTFGISAVTQVGSTDLALVKLSSSVIGADMINFLPVLDFGVDASWIGKDLILYGRNETGAHTSPTTGIGSVSEIGSLSEGGSTGVIVVSRFENATAAADEAYFQTGDSGSPMLGFSTSGTLGIAGVNWAVGTDAEGADSASTRVKDYTSAMNSIMAGDGESVTVVPEPGAVLLFAGGLAALSLRRRVLAAIR